MPSKEMLALVAELKELDEPARWIYVIDQLATGEGDACWLAARVLTTPRYFEELLGHVLRAGLPDPGTSAWLVMLVGRLGAGRALAAIERLAEQHPDVVRLHIRALRTLLAIPERRTNLRFDALANRLLGEGPQIRTSRWTPFTRDELAMYADVVWAVSIRRMPPLVELPDLELELIARDRELSLVCRQVRSFEVDFLGPREAQPLAIERVEMGELLTVARVQINCWEVLRRSAPSLEPLRTL